MVGAGLSDDEKDLLRIFVQSPVYRLLVKLVDQDKAMAMSQLEKCDTTTEMHRLQGRIAHTNFLKNVPALLASQFEAQDKIKKKKEEQKNKKPNNQ